MALVEGNTVYGLNEEGWRRTVWEKNMKMIDLHNQEYNLGRQSFTLAMNAFGDMTRIHLVQLVPLKNRCSGKLSEQNLVDCFQAEGNEGCNGGLMDNAFQYVKSNGCLNSEESCPYHAKVGPCKYRSEDSVANDTGFVDIPEQESALMKAVATVGPISVAIDASHLSFRFYEDGIYYERHYSGVDLDHSILVVGYGFKEEESSNNKYWIVKNSWGEVWGKSGYVKMAKDRNNYCGIATAASYPTV
ncbi:Cathepsin L1 [Myotis brandtii]|uniref:Cathepsin L1 n=1 Tax=Myotis brandtii TaxID=109478 RepID=S7P1N3_MYOBR|nr:Cathepsin L1 [Myotis brandtii]